MSKQTLIILIIVLVFAGAGVWFFYFQSSSSTTTDQAANTDTGAVYASSNPDVQQIERELVDLRRLKDLQIDTSILQNPFLKSLEAPRTISGGTGTSTAYATPGRTNPFLPF